MKKIIKTSLFLATLLSVGVMTTSAKTMSAEELNKLVTVNIGGQDLSQNLYIYGKYVYVNSITSAELNDAMNDLSYDSAYANEYRELFTNNVIALIHKDANNNWENLTYGGALAKEVSMEMTHLIGSKNGEHISNEAGIYDGTYIKEETLPNGKISETFVDEKAELSIVGVRAVSKIATLNNSNISTDTHRYNTSAVDISYSKDLTITMNKPVLSYNNGTDAGKWIGLLIKTNKAIVDDDEFKLKDSVIKLEDATEHGGDSREYIVWVNLNTVTDDGNGIDLTVNPGGEGVTQTIKTHIVNNVKETITIPSFASDAEPQVTDITEGYSSVSALIDGKYTVMLYSNKAAKVNDVVDFTLDGDLKRAVNKGVNNWTIGDLIDVVSVEKTPVESGDNDDVKWNKEAISSVELSEESGENYSYVVNIHTNKVPDLTKGVNVNVDLSALVDGSGENATVETSPIENTTTYKVALKALETVVTFTNRTVDLKDENVSIKFVITDETPEMKATITKANSDVDIFEGTRDSKEHAANDGLVKNLNNSEFNSTYDEKTKVYNVEFKAVSSDDKVFDPFTIPSKSNITDAQTTGQSTPHSYFAVIVDLGVDPTKLQYNSASTSNYTGTNMSIPAVDIANAERFGASTETSFLMWVSEVTGKVTFKNTETNKTVALNFIISKLIKGYVVDVEDKTSENTVEIADDYKFNVKYEAGKGFTLTNAMTLGTKFVASTTETKGGVTSTKEYTYVVKKGMTDCAGVAAKVGTGTYCVKKVENPKLLRALTAAPSSESDDLRYNLSSVASVTIDGNVVNVTFNRNTSNVKKTFALMLDMNVSSLSGEENAIKLNGRSLEVANANRFTGTGVTENFDNFGLTWVTIDPENEIELELTHSKNGVESIPYKVVVKTTIDNKAPELELKKAEKVNYDPNHIDHEDDKFGDSGDHKYLITNNNYINSVSVEDGKIVVGYNHKMDHDTFAILVDLGIKPEWININSSIDGAATMNVTDLGASKLGYSGTEFLLFVHLNKLTGGAGTIELTFDQNNAANTINRYGEPVKITLVVNDEINRITVTSDNLKTRDASIKSTEEWSYDEVAYAANQNNYVYELEDTTQDIKTKGTGKLTIKKRNDNVQPSYYVLQGFSKPYAWYAVEVDLGVKIKSISEGTGFHVQVVDYNTGKFVLWMNLFDATASRTVTVANDYNDTTYELTLDYSNVK